MLGYFSKVKGKGYVCYVDPVGQEGCSYVRLLLKGKGYVCVLTQWDKRGAHMLGYFSRVKGMCVMLTQWDYFSKIIGKGYVCCVDPVGQEGCSYVRLLLKGKG